MKNTSKAFVIITALAVGSTALTQQTNTFAERIDDCLQNIPNECIDKLSNVGWDLSVEYIGQNEEVVADEINVIRDQIWVESLRFEIEQISELIANMKCERLHTSDEVRIIELTNAIEVYSQEREELEKELYSSPQILNK